MIFSSTLILNLWILCIIIICSMYYALFVYFLVLIIVYIYDMLADTNERRDSFHDHL